MTEPFYDLITVLQERKARPGPDSYTTQLLTAGEDEIIKKIGEEVIELILRPKHRVMNVF